jgi:hypothetical protein
MYQALKARTKHLLAIRWVARSVLPTYYHIDVGAAFWSQTVCREMAR